MNDLYRRIEDLCLRNNVTITKMCKDCGASRGSLTDLKSGRIKLLNSATLSKIATYFNVSVSYLLGEENEKSPTGQEADEAKSIDYLLSKMTPAELAELMGKVAQELKERGLE